MSKIILKEILFEVTNQCNKNCAYCGSKDVTSKCNPLSKEDRLKIVSEIVKLGPEKVTITGGEPGLMSLEVANIARELKRGGIKEVGLVTNGTNFLWMLCCDGIDTIGLSVNTEEDIVEAMKLLQPRDSSTEALVKKKLTIVTNFGIHNIFSFSKLYDFVKSINGFWQIQLTMGDYQLAPGGITHLYREIEEKLSRCSHTGYVLSDNLQPSHNCSAGISSLSVTYTGDVVSCLSKRSWGKMETHGNLLDGSFNWKTAFHQERFCEQCECCRDYIKYPDQLVKVPVLKERGTQLPASMFPTYKELPSSDSRIIMYGISIDRQRDYPGAPQFPNVYAYAVFRPDSFSGTQ